MDGSNINVFISLRHSPYHAENWILSITVEHPGVLGIGEAVTGNLEKELSLEFKQETSCTRQSKIS